MAHPLQAVVDHFQAEINHNVFWANRHREDGHLASAQYREDHIRKLTGWIVALQAAIDQKPGPSASQETASA
ncbi:hypothetical protein [Hansschlegelia zhihuaiae]|uniref:Uncharacterized protein n=1 Tax=Hansschlegelia zhihuaiae TaxID=405005 RepID=A0A4Q0MMM2_9HYPH|nr:hypothetical protein [Hansschlegelia zhihuaiae]RXF75041.1 hypothetical protein EK403_03050 [Hansschlegelia zhihuaiae]